MSLPPATELALQAAGLIGTWNTDVQAARSILDDGAAALLAGDAGLAGQPLPLEIALQRTHQDDRDWVFDRIRRMRRTGGPFSAEFRVRTATHDVKWVLTLGTLAPDEAGMMRGRGCYIDTTSAHTQPFWKGDPAEVQATAFQKAVDPLDVASDRSIDAHTAIVQMGDTAIRQASETVLWLLGRALAQRERVRRGEFFRPR
jgi:hypothetical protein